MKLKDYFTKGEMEARIKKTKEILEREDVKLLGEQLSECEKCDNFIECDNKVDISKGLKKLDIVEIVQKMYDIGGSLLDEKSKLIYNHDIIHKHERVKDLSFEIERYLIYTQINTEGIWIYPSIMLRTLEAYHKWLQEVYNECYVKGNKQSDEGDCLACDLN